MLTARGRERERGEVAKPQAYVSTGPNQVWSWDISFLRSPVTGLFYYLYIILDVFSRKIVGAAVHGTQDDQYAADLMGLACFSEGVERDQLVLHADNGGPMKGVTLLKKLEALGVARSYSRPGVCDDNPYSEALFRTAKYHPEYPRTRFASLEDARNWVEGFVSWYNTEHLHSGIRYTRPIDRHEGRDAAILEARQRVYEEARDRHPQRWGGRAVRNWERVETVSLNPDKEKAA
jgi:putative transposase